jgi:hypothetical protein
MGATDALSAGGRKDVLVVGRDSGEGDKRAQRALEKLRSKREADAPAKPADAKPDESKPEKSADPVKAAEPKPAEKPAELQREDLAARAQLEKFQRLALEQERARIEADQRAKELQAKLEAQEKANPLDYLKSKGLSLEQLLRDAQAGKIKPTTEIDIAVDGVRGEIAQFKNEFEQLRQWKAEQDAQARLEHVKSRLSERAEALPLSSSISWVAEQARNRYDAMRANGEDADFDAVLGAFESAIATDAKALLSNERSLKALLADGELRKQVRAAIDALEPKKTKAAPASQPGDPRGENGLTTIPRDVAAVTGSRSTSIPSEHERLAAARAALQRRRA